MPLDTSLPYLIADARNVLEQGGERDMRGEISDRLRQICDALESPAKIVRVIVWDEGEAQTYADLSEAAENVSDFDEAVCLYSDGAYGPCDSALLKAIAAFDAEGASIRQHHASVNAHTGRA